jgi:hypothetical protein
MPSVLSSAVDAFVQVVPTSGTSSSPGTRAPASPLFWVGAEPRPLLGCHRPPLGAKICTLPLNLDPGTLLMGTARPCCLKAPQKLSGTSNTRNLRDDEALAAGMLEL